MNEARHRQHENPAGNADRGVSQELHPRVYALAIGLAAWLVLSVWSFAAGGGTADYLLFIVSGFIFVAVGLPFILSRVQRADDGAMDDGAPREIRPLSFRDWAAKDFAIWEGRLSGAQAALQVLLPIAAVAFGMTAFGIAVHIAEHSGAL